MMTHEFDELLDLLHQLERSNLITKVEYKTEASTYHGDFSVTLSFNVANGLSDVKYRKIQTWVEAHYPDLFMGGSPDKNRIILCYKDESNN